MARPVCDHCLEVFEDNPDEEPDAELVCADAYLFTCDRCAGPTKDHPAADCADRYRRALERDRDLAQRQLERPDTARWRDQLVARVAYLQACIDQRTA